jgi:pyruvate-ferredoxin/flavodoxin oxidoreductase
MKLYKTMDGNQACATIAYLFTEIAGIYPITPSSPMAELSDEWSNKEYKNIFDDTVKVVEMQSEVGAIALVHGALQSGCLATTFTASQGLLLMIPNMYKISGELLPGVIHVASRSIATHALSILGDHQDIYATRMTGFAIMASSSVQQVMDLSAVVHLSAIKGSVPFLNFFEGFRTSHELQKIEVLNKKDVLPLIEWESINRFRDKSLSHFNRVIRGTAQNEDIYFQATEVRNKDYDAIPDIVNEYMQKINCITGRNYQPFNYYGHEAPTDIIIAMGSVCETIKETIDYLVMHNEKVGLLEVHLYRPFSEKYFFNAFPKTVERIAVLDRTKEPGSSGEPLYLDVVNMFNQKEQKPLIIGGRYGLSGKDVTPADIRAVYDFLRKKNNFHGFTVGIKDDVTNLSIPVLEFKNDCNNVLEFLIYGYGSDGMISCAKDIIKIIGDNTEANVQGYFQYDSKKSGALTRGHIRLSLNPIRSTYYVHSPNLVVCSKEAYLGRYDMLSNIKNNGKFLFVTALNEKSVVELLSNDIKRLLARRNIRFYIIDAYALANKHGLKNKVSTIVETCIFKISRLIDHDFAISRMKDHIVDVYTKKGTSIVEANIKVVDEAIDYLKEIKVDPNWANLEPKEESLLVKDSVYDNKVFTMMNNLEGNELTVSDFLDYKDGTYVNGTTQYEKRAIAENVPKWIPENCIQCNLCSYVCPHAVVRPYLLNEDEYNNAPPIIKDQAIKAVGSDYKFQIGVSTFDCTGCTVCVKVCPGKGGDKALEMVPFEKTEHENGCPYLLNKVSIKEEQIKPTVKGSQFQKPLFEFHGACAGCGETPYLKLLTQLFGDRLIIANATGCTSIYGASMPSMPYHVPWANSLFEVDGNSYNP